MTTFGVLDQLRTRSRSDTGSHTYIRPALLSITSYSFAPSRRRIVVSPLHLLSIFFVLPLWKSTRVSLIHFTIMTSYLRSIFGGYQPTPIHTAHSSSHSSPHRSKTHSRSNSIPSVNPASANYIYSTTPSSTSSRSRTNSRPTPKRSQSFSARTGAPSPLRFNTSGSAASHHSDSGHKRDPLYRRASYKTPDHCTYILLARLTTFSEAFSLSQRAGILNRLVMPAHDQIRAHPFFLEWVPRDQLPVLGDPVCRGLIILGMGAKRQVLEVRHRAVSCSAISALPVANISPFKSRR